MSETGSVMISDWCYYQLLYNECEKQMYKTNTYNQKIDLGIFLNRELNEWQGKHCTFTVDFIFNPVVSGVH